MIEQEIFRSVERARDRLTALHTRLAQRDPGSMSTDVLDGLKDLQTSMQKLQTRYGLLLQVLDRTTDLICAKDRDGRYSMINPRGAELFGRTVVEVLGVDDRVLLGGADAERIMDRDRNVMQDGLAQTVEETLDVQGVDRTLITTTTPWYDTQLGIRGVLGVAQDVTEQRDSERDVVRYVVRLRSLAATAAIDEERLRHSLAADLHNELGQEIALIKLKLSSLKATTAAEWHDPLIGILRLVDQADKTLRSITYQISPASLYDLGLLPALQWLGEDIHRRYGLSVQFLDSDSPTVADEWIRVILFRAVRELLVNAATHAHTAEAVVRLANLGDSIRITVEDSGSGFDTGDLDRHGYGLFGIREQCKYVHGTMEIDSTPGSGTTVTLTVPVQGRAVHRTP